MPRIGERGWIHSGVKVFDNTAAPTGWTDLDLSAVVGKNRALAFLKLKNKHASDTIIYYFRMNGDTEEIGIGGLTCCMNNIAILDPDRIGHFVSETDNNGVAEWKATSGGNTDIWVLGYIR